ncbi:MAG: stage V sporulation protein AD [Clostridia bacterium]|nr:stage V sporulation protein AD [Clostridia bacterium]
MEKNRKIIDTSGAVIVSCASAVGGKEFEGPLGACFDFHDPTDSFGQKTFERSEAEMQRLVLATAISRIGAKASDIDALFAGDLLNQCVSSAYGLLEYDIPYFGLYGACSTAAEGLMLASVFASRGITRMAAAVTSSHNAAAERQYRNPLEYGGQRTPTAQWTVTGAGAFVVSNAENAERDNVFAEVIEAFPGIVVEKGITDAANMGAAMAPAAADTLLNYFEVSGTSPSDFDMIVSGDLGKEGVSILGEILSASGVDASEKLFDCGMMIYDAEAQDVHAGGSGCGCSAVVLASHLFPKLKSGEISEILFYGTGAMMSPSSLKQGLAIPAVAHLLRLRSPAAKYK